MKSWKTTVGGALAALGAVLTAGGDGWVQTLGAILTGAGVLLTGVSARDNTKTSEDVGAKK